MKKKTEVKLSIKHEAFCNELVKDWNETQAYSRAYNNKNFDSCAASATKLLTHPKIKNRVKELKDQRNLESLVDVKYVTDKAKFIINTDFTDLMELGAKGATREEFDKVPKAIRCLIKSFSITTRRDKDGSEVETIKFKLMDKDRAHDILAKHTGTYNDSAANINIGIGSLSEMLKSAKDKAGNE